MRSGPITKDIRDSKGEVLIKTSAHEISYCSDLHEVLNNFEEIDLERFTIKYTYTPLLFLIFLIDSNLGIVDGVKYTLKDFKKKTYKENHFKKDIVDIHTSLCQILWEILKNG